METNLVIEGFKFLILGMGTVLIFLVVLILLMNLQRKIIERFFPEPQGISEAPGATPGTQAKDTKKIVAAISAAIMHHNKA
ncbi:MAG: pyruvate carboxylase [Sulfurimonas sp.]|nr:MAG: pyruvate carboxylase [Sulfurimonas sp.]